MNKLNQLFQETFSQYILTPEIYKHISPKLFNTFKKIGITSILAVIAFPGISYADGAVNTGLGLSALLGVAVNHNKNNLPFECSQVSGTNGWAVAGGGIAGTLLGHQVGGGRGRSLATLIGGLTGATLMDNQQNKRMQDECNKVIASNQYNNSPNLMNNEPILYQAINSQGYPTIVTMQSSLGLKALNGEIQGTLPISNDIHIKNAVESSLNNLSNIYKEFEQTSYTYLDLVNNKNNSVRYSTNNEQIYNYNNNLFLNVKNILNKEDDLLNKYAEARGKAANILDHAVEDNINLNDYKNYVNLFTPPKSAQITFSTAYSKPLPNRYAVGLIK